MSLRSSGWGGLVVHESLHTCGGFAKEVVMCPTLLPCLSPSDRVCHWAESQASSDLLACTPYKARITGLSSHILLSVRTRVTGAYRLSV